VPPHAPQLAQEVAANLLGVENTIHGVTTDRAKTLKKCGKKKKLLRSHTTPSQVADRPLPAPVLCNASRFAPKLLELLCRRNFLVLQHVQLIAEATADGRLQLEPMPSPDRFNSPVNEQNNMENSW